jgi:hypothetical protein
MGRSDHNLEAIMSDLHTNIQLAPEHSDFFGRRFNIASDDLRSAVREDCTGNALPLAPLQLHRNGCVPNQCVISLAR